MIKPARKPLVEVDLPADEYIELFHLLVLITRAKHFDLEDARGAESVIGKLVKSNHRKDGERLPLTARDKQTLRKLEKHLPDVFPRASDYEKLKFAAEYASLVKRVNWLPVIASDDEAYRDRMDIIGELVDERNTLILAIKNETISVFDEKLIRQHTYYPKYLIARSDAIAFIRAHGMFQLHPSPPTNGSAIEKKLYIQEALNFFKINKNKTTAAKKYGCNRGTLSRWEKGESDDPKEIELISRIITADGIVKEKKIRAVSQSIGFEASQQINWAFGLMTAPSVRSKTPMSEKSPQEPPDAAPCS